MPKNALKLLLLLVLIYLWDVLFWHQVPGLNLLLFVLALVGAIIAVRLTAFRSWSVVSFGVMSLIVASMVVVHNSALSIIVLFLMLFSFIGYSLVPEIRSIWFAGLTALLNYMKMPFKAYTYLSQKVLGEKRATAFIRVTRLAIIPVLVTLVFYFIYKGANPRFDTLTADFFGSFNEFLTHLFEGLFTARGFFILFGIVLIAGALYRSNPIEALRMESKHKDVLTDARTMEPDNKREENLANEYRTGIILLIMVNAILLIVNIIDIDWIWSGFEVPVDFSLKSFVHEGTWLLILSIVLSMFILFYLFRSGQNFFKPNGWLNKLAYLWVAQNLVLGFSVFMRNYHYISFHGLAYKRIGVIVFLLLVLIGLASMFIKIRQKRTLFYLVRVNSWAAAGLFCIMTVVNWDTFIVNYNLDHSNPAEIDVDNYLRLSSKVLPIIYADLEKVERQMSKHMENKVRWIDHTDPVEFREQLDHRKERFLEMYKESEWPSWNLADQRTYNALLAMDLVPKELMKK